ncbi:MAG: YncE family protein, partial [Pigmentiphaga sp.]
ISYGGTVLNAGGKPYVANDKGEINGVIQLPANAAPARHPLVVEMAKPTAAAVVDLKVSPDVPLSGQDRFTVEAKKLVPGLYQVAYSPKADRLFVTSAIGRPPVKESQLVKVNPKTLEVEASVTPAAQPGRDDGQVFAVYGVGVDDANGNVWVTNTRQNTVAVYRQSDLGLVKQFESGAAAHARDVLVVPGAGKAYVSTPGHSTVVVFDTTKLEPLTTIDIKALKRGDEFSSMSLAADGDGKVYAVGSRPDEVAVIDIATDTVDKVLPVPGVFSASGVAVDPKTKRVFVAAQGSDNVVVLDAESGDVIATTPVGAGALNVSFDPIKRLAYVSNRGADTVTVLDENGKVVANLEGGSFPNQAAIDGKGSVFAVNKARGGDDAAGDHVRRITPR